MSSDLLCHTYSIASHPEWAIIHLKAPESENRTPIHLCCIIDTSASMEDDRKLEHVKRSLHYLLDYLGEKDHLSIITFSNTATTLLHYVQTEINQKEHIRSTLSRIHADCSTNLSAAIIQARSVLQRNVADVKQGILLLTDGHANAGIIDASHITSLCNDTLREFPGTSLSCIGYGTDHNALLLQTMATEGGGSYSIVNNLEDVATVFGNILGGLISCSFQQVQIRLPPGTEIKSRYYAEENMGHMNIMVGDLAAGTEAVILANLCYGTRLEVNGFDIHKLQSFVCERLITTTDDSTLQLNAEAHYMRFEILSLLDDISKRTETTSRLLNRVETYIEQITAKRVTHPHALWELLLNELEECKKTICEPASRHRESLMTQRRTYLGLMKGSPSQASQDAYQLFSNSAQRQISANLTQNVSQRIDEMEDVSDNDDNINTQLY